MLVKTKKGIATKSSKLLAAKDGILYYKIDRLEFASVQARYGFWYEEIKPSPVYLSYHVQRAGSEEEGEHLAEEALAKIIKEEYAA